MADLTIKFRHIASGMQVEFLAFLKAFNDTYDAEWSSEKVFGRMDPIAQYKGTTRKINCSFTVPSNSHGHAYLNNQKVSTLLKMLYPTYNASSGLGVYVIASPPLIEVKFNNLIRNTEDKSFGLLGYIPSLKYEPDIESPIFTFSQENITNDSFLAEAEKTKILQNISGDSELIGWQSLTVNFDLNVLHTHRLGYNNKLAANTGVTTFKKFPYGLLGQ